MKIDLMKTKNSFFQFSILMIFLIRPSFMVLFVRNHIKKQNRN